MTYPVQAKLLAACLKGKLEFKIFLALLNPLTWTKSAMWHKMPLCAQYLVNF